MGRGGYLPLPGQVCHQNSRGLPLPSVTLLLAGLRLAAAVGLIYMYRLLVGLPSLGLKAFCDCGHNLASRGFPFLPFILAEQVGI